MASPPDERIPRPDQNFISRGLARDREREAERERGGKRVLREGKGGRSGREEGERMETRRARLSARKSLLNGPFHGTAFSSRCGRGWRGG